MTKSLQTSGYTLSNCKSNLGGFLEYVEEESSKEESIFFGKMFDPKYILPNPSIVYDQHLESGVVKIQNDDCNALN